MHTNRVVCRERQNYRASWEADPLFQKWLNPSSISYRAFCTQCQCEISARYGDILRHSKTTKHLRAMEYGGVLPGADYVNKAELPEGENGTSKRKPKAKPKRKYRKKGVIEEPKAAPGVSDFIISSVHEQVLEPTEFTQFGTYFEPVAATKTEECDSKLMSTLYEIDTNNYNYLYKRCKDLNVKSHQLPYLKTDHIRELIPKTQLGIMAEFEFMLNKWKAANGYLNDVHYHSTPFSTEVA